MANYTVCLYMLMFIVHGEGINNGNRNEDTKACS